MDIPIEDVEAAAAVISGGPVWVDNFDRAAALEALTAPINQRRTNLREDTDMSDKSRTVAEVRGTIVMADGSTSEFSIGTDFGWQQWGAVQERLGRSVAVLEAMVTGFKDEEVSFVSDYDEDAESEDEDELFGD